MTNRAITQKKRLLTGDRPTGALHIGHLVGSLLNRVQLQHEYQCFFLIADLHMLTTCPTKNDIKNVSAVAREMILDYAAVGLQMEQSIWYLQSAVPEVTELTLYLSMLVSVPRLQRLPSLKDMVDAAALTEMPHGLLGYPILQAADILLPRAHIVPVGKDNEAHVELTRELARRFNTMYGEVFPIPQVMIGSVPTLVGTDGNAKMSKSLKNTILLSDDETRVRKRVMSMFTDPNRTRADIPGVVEGNPVFIYHDIFNDNKKEVANLKERYRRGTVGDVEVKQKLAYALNQYLAPLRERRIKYAAMSGYSEEILYTGTKQMRTVAQETITKVRRAMGFSGIWNKISKHTQTYDAHRKTDGATQQSNITHAKSASVTHKDATDALSVNTDAVT